MILAGLAKLHWSLTSVMNPPNWTPAILVDDTLILKLSRQRISPSAYPLVALFLGENSYGMITTRRRRQRNIARLLLGGDLQMIRPTREVDS